MVNVFFNGRLGADAEVRTSNDGVQFLTCSVAVNEYINGEEKTSWMRVRSREDRFIKLAQYLKKGSLVSVSGKENIGTFQGKSGETLFSRDVTAFNIQFIKAGNKNENTDDKTQENTNEPTNAQISCGTFQPNQTTTVTQQMVTVGSASLDTDNDDDLPF